MRRRLLKYVEVGRISVRSAWAYVWNQLLATLFLVIVLYVFVQLWRATFAAEGAVINGYTLPAALISTLPVDLVREFDWLGLLGLAGAAAIFMGLGVWTFHLGLRRYESGNLLSMRS